MLTKNKTRAGLAMARKILSHAPILAVVFAFLVVGCVGGKPARQHYEKAGGFSYDPPDGWTPFDLAGFKYRIFRGPAKDGFAPNINVVDEPFAGTLDDYAKANLANMRNVFVNFSLIKQGEMTTADGDPVVFLIARNEQQRRMLRQTFYLLGSGNRKFVFTCTATADSGEAWDPVFERSAKTFRFH